MKNHFIINFVESLMITTKESFFNAIEANEYKEVEKYLSKTTDHPVVVSNFVNSKRTFRDNWTGLHIAAHNDNLPMCQLLISYGANVLARDVKGKTAAECTSNQEIKELCQQKAPGSTTISPVHQQANDNRPFSAPQPSSAKTANLKSSISEPSIEI